MPISTRIKDLFLTETLRRARELSPKGFSQEFNALGRALRDKARAGFAAETDPYGNPWAPLSKNTIAMKRLEGLAHPEAILIATGLLMNSFEYRALVNGVRLFNNRTFEDGTGAEIHQEGGFSPTSHNFIPARPMLPLTGEFPADWMIPVEDAIGDGIDRIFK